MQMQAFNEREDRFIARKLSGLMAQSQKIGKVTMREELIEYQIVDELLSVLFKHCHELGLLPASVKKSDIVLTYSDVTSNSNYHNLTMLSNGSLFMSESFLTKLLNLD